VVERASTDDMKRPSMVAGVADGCDLEGETTNS